MAMLVYRAVVEAGFDKVATYSSNQGNNKEAVYDSNEYSSVALQVRARLHYVTKPCDVGHMAV